MENKKEVKVEEVKLSDIENVANDNQVTESDNSEVDALNAKVSELNDKYLRLAAELENTRRRAALDAENTARSRVMSISANFLPVMDAIDAALGHNPSDEGIQAMARAMESAFAKSGIVKIESMGQQLNPQFHNAVQVAETPASDEPCAVKPVPNTIVAELQTGYMFGDTVLRPAMVVVSK
ncbi:MAG: nucleotide exchange factor GrpE [Rickettsiales bacterium]|nr:nucleotide exchange factor GrpE [Rickettsiales bacterium]